MKIHGIKIDTVVIGDEIRHTVKDTVGNYMSAIIVRTQDAQTKAALKKLGWLSPEEGKRIVEVIHMLHNEIGRSLNCGLEIIKLIEENQS